MEKENGDHRAEVGVREISCGLREKKRRLESGMVWSWRRRMAEGGIRRRGLGGSE